MKSWKERTNGIFFSKVICFTSTFILLSHFNLEHNSVLYWHVQYTVWMWKHFKNLFVLIYMFLHFSLKVETRYFHDLLKPSLSSLGFNGQFFSKVDDKDEGSAIFYKLSSMELISQQNFVFKDQVGS